MTVRRQHFAAANAEMISSKRVFDLAVLDPPRAGLKEQAALVAAIVDKAVIYVSCNAETLVKDLQRFSARGFKISRVTALDMFPMTGHWETVVLLVRA